MVELPVGTIKMMVHGAGSWYVAFGFPLNRLFSRGFLYELWPRTTRENIPTVGTGRAMGHDLVRMELFMCSAFTEIPAVILQVPMGAEENGAVDAAAVEAEVDLSIFDLSKKKKRKKKPKPTAEGPDEEGGEGGEQEEGEGRYNYETLLGRIQVRCSLPVVCGI